MYRLGLLARVFPLPKHEIDSDSKRKHFMINRHPHRENVENIWAISLPIVAMQHIRESPSASHAMRMNGWNVSQCHLFRIVSILVLGVWYITYNSLYNAGQKKRNSDPWIFCELPGRGRSTLKLKNSKFRVAFLLTSIVKGTLCMMTLHCLSDQIWITALHRFVFSKWI